MKNIHTVGIHSSIKVLLNSVLSFFVIVVCIVYTLDHKKHEIRFSEDNIVQIIVFLIFILFVLGIIFDVYIF